MSEQLVKAIDKLENGHGKLQSAIFDMGKQQAVQNEQLGNLSKILEKVVYIHDGRLMRLEENKNITSVYWKIAITFASIAFSGVLFLAWQSVVSQATNQHSQAPTTISQPSTLEK